MPGRENKKHNNTACTGSDDIRVWFDARCVTAFKSHHVLYAVYQSICTRHNAMRSHMV
jgi:hypothetical protein